MNPSTSVTKTGWNSFHWFLRRGVQKVFRFTHSRMDTPQKHNASDIEGLQWRKHKNHINNARERHGLLHNTRLNMQVKTEWQNDEIWCYINNGKLYKSVNWKQAFTASVWRYYCVSHWFWVLTAFEIHTTSCKQWTSLTKKLTEMYLYKKWPKRDSQMDWKLLVAGEYF